MLNGTCFKTSSADTLKIASQRIHGELAVKFGILLCEKEDILELTNVCTIEPS